MIAGIAEILASGAAGPANPLAVPFGDDMAPLSPADPALLWTTDMLMDGVDFESARHAWRDIGRKAMAVNLSDCAAMGATPIAALCALALGDALRVEDALDIVRGAHECGLRYGCPIVGGDTNGWAAPTAIAITVAARMPPGLVPLRRDGARPGDRIFISGPVGGSLLGRHMTFEPRVELARQLSAALRPTAAIDVSDGLSLDLWRICEASGVGAELDANGLDAAIHADARTLAAQSGRSARAHALGDGEDFELIVTIGESRADEAVARFGLLPIGRIVAERGLRLRSTDGTLTPLEPRGWEHLR